MEKVLNRMDIKVCVIFFLCLMAFFFLPYRTKFLAILNFVSRTRGGAPYSGSSVPQSQRFRFIRVPHYSLALQVNLASGAPNSGEMVKSGLHSGWPIHPNTSGQTVPSQGPSILPAVVCSSVLASSRSPSIARKPQNPQSFHSA